MKKSILLHMAVCIIACIVIASTEFAEADIDYTSAHWSVEHIINNSQTVLGVDQGLGGVNGPRNNRSLALSPDGDFMYLGYGEPSVGWMVRKVETGFAPEDNLNAVKSQLSLTDEGKGLEWAKAIDTDDQGRVYMTRNTEIQIYDADLTNRLLTVTGLSAAEGIHVARKDSGQMYLYNSERSVTTGQLKRMVIDESTMFLGGTMAWSGDASFGTSGMASLGVAFDDVRGLASDAFGNIWAAENDDFLLKVSGDGSSVSSIALSDAFDVAVDGSHVFVTQDDDRTVSVIDANTMGILDTLSIPFVGLDLDPTGQSGLGTLGAIDLIPGMDLYVTNEYGQSITPSPFSGYPGDDNEPVLKLTVMPEPISSTLFIVGGAVLGFRQRRKRATA